MLGSKRISRKKSLTYSVSKPYRYARKQSQLFHSIYCIHVSKPYRYARKLLFFLDEKKFFFCFKTLQVCQEVTKEKYDKACNALGFKTLQVCQEGRGLRILGSPFYAVSKPYRYARKMCHLGITQPHVHVSKPYRYARKVFFIFFPSFPFFCFKTLQVCQEGRIILPRPPLLPGFKTLQVCQEVSVSLKYSIFPLQFQNLIGMLGRLMMVLEGMSKKYVSKPYRYARKIPKKAAKPSRVSGFKTLQVCQEAAQVAGHFDRILSFKTLQVCQEVNTSTVAFRVSDVVSKPYRYARK